MKPLQFDQHFLPIILLNIRSIKSKCDELETLLLGYQTLPIVLLTETWLSTDDPDILLPCYLDYNIYRSDRDGRRGGGVLIMVPKLLTSYVITMPANTKDFESVWVYVDLCRNIRIRLGLFYSPPATNSDSLINFLEPILNAPIPTVVLGDFNYPNINWTTNTAPPIFGQDNFLNFILRVGLHQEIDFCTRKSSVLDLLFVNEPNLVQKIQCGPPIKGCDHVTIEGYLSYQSPKHRFSVYRDYLNADYETISAELAHIQWTVCLGKLSVEEMWFCFLFILNRVFDKYISFCTVRTVHNFWSARVNRLCKRVYKFHCRYKMTERREDYEKYLEASRVAQRAKRSEKYKSEKDVLESDNLNRFWKFVKTKLSNKSSIPCLLDELDNPVTENVGKAQMFNEFFVSVFTPDNKTMSLLPSPNPSNFLSHIEFSPATVYAELCKSSNKLSSGPDNLSNFVLKKLSLVLAEPLSIIFTQSFATSTLPLDWRSAHVIPIFKNKGKKDSCQNYRPISLTVNCCNKMERLIYPFLSEHLRPLVDKNQHGFLSGKSTVSQLLLCINDWIRNLDKGFSIDVIYIDIAKAFDSVCHAKLIAILRTYGVVGLLLDWVKAFLFDRRQRVVVDGDKSDWAPVTSGVPQGSILGPLLFLIYINDIGTVIRNCKFKLFADDCKIYIPIIHGDCQNNEGFQADINRVAAWATNLQLQIAFSKSFILHIGPKNPGFIYYFENLEIPTIGKVKDLGVTVQSDLKFHEHYANIVQSASVMCNMIFKSFLSRKTDFLIRMYTTFARPRLEYATQVWSPHYLKDIDLIESVQRRFTKRVPGMQGLSYPQRLVSLKLQSLELRRLIFDMVFTYKILHGLIDIDFTEFFVFSQSGTRGHDLKLYKSKFKHDFSKYFFANRVVDVWNQLPNSVITAPNINIFKGLINQTDLSKYLKGRGLKV